MNRPRRPSPDPERVVTLTQEQAEIFMRMAESALQVLRDDVPFEKARHLFGQVILEKSPLLLSFSQPEFPSIYVDVNFRGTRFDNRIIIGSIRIYANDYAENINRQTLSGRLKLPESKNRSRPRRSLPTDSKTTFSYTLKPEGEGYPVLLDLHYSLAGTFPMRSLDDELPEHTRYFVELFIDRYWDEVPKGPMTRSTGERCPLSGAWTPEGMPEQEIYVQRGEPLPVWQDKAVKWVWKDHGFIN